MTESVMLKAGGLEANLRAYYPTIPDEKLRGIAYAVWNDNITSLYSPTSYEVGTVVSVDTSLWSTGSGDVPLHDTTIVTPPVG